MWRTTGTRSGRRRHVGVPDCRRAVDGSSMYCMTLGLEKATTTKRNGVTIFSVFFSCYRQSG
jgi:hypothetical protein